MSTVRSTIDSRTFAGYAADPAAFRADLIIDADGSPARFGDVMEPWQKADFAALDPALRACNGRAVRGGPPPLMRHYLERSRGHSKTTDIAVACAWALAFATRPIRGFAYAADRDQAALLKQAMETLVRLNPWLGDILAVENNRVVNTAAKHPGKGGTLVIETSDVASSYGILPDLIVADELTHWEGDGSLWHSLISSAAKRKHCLVFVIANAGFAETWPWAVREVARTDPAWHFSRLDGPMASWLTESRLAEQRRMLPPTAFARLWLNTWSAAGGDALTPEDVHAAFDPTLRPMTGGDRLTGLLGPTWRFVAGVDLGLVRDASAVVVLAIPSGPGHERDRIRLAHHRLWRPPGDGRKVNLTEIEQHILKLDEEYRLEAVGFDPWQAEHLAQRVETIWEHRARSSYSVSKHRKAFMREVPPTAANLREQATLTIESFQDHRFALYDCPPLRTDLLKLRAEEMSYGIRLTSPRDGEGHGDTFSAFALALLVGHELSAKKPAVAGTGGGKARPVTAGAVGERLSLMDMNARVAGRAADALAREQAILAERQERMREYPAYLDNPLYQALKRAGSPRVI